MPIPDTLTAPELAELLGMTDRRVRQLADEGVFSNVGTGSRYAFRPGVAVASWVAHRINCEIAESGTSDADYERERARLTKFKADKAEVEAALIKGRSHDGDAVAFHVGQMLSAFRARILSIPNSCAGIVAELIDPEACREVIEDQCRSALMELRDYDPRTVEQTTRERLHGKTEADDS